MVMQYREEYTPDTERALRRLHDRIGPRVRPLPKRRPRILYAAAAAVSLLILATVAVLVSRDSLTQLANNGTESAEYTLPDGSRLVLQSGSQLAYDAEAYLTDGRNVTLDGQAYFEVEHDASLPFTVRHGQSQLRVMGTAFNVRAHRTEMEVEVSEGSVVLFRDDEEIVLGTKECGIAREGQPLKQTEAPNLNHHAWRTGTLQFDRTPIREVLGYFRDNWHFDVRWGDGTPCHYTVSGRFSGADAGAVLADIAKLGGLRVQPIGEDGKSYELLGDCPQ